MTISGNQSLKNKHLQMSIYSETARRSTCSLWNGFMVAGNVLEVMRE